MVQMLLIVASAIMALSYIFCSMSQVYRCEPLFQEQSRCAESSRIFKQAITFQVFIYDLIFLVPSNLFFQLGR